RLEEFLERDMVHVRLTDPFRFVAVGAPSYLQRRGVPETPKDLLAHECIRVRSPTTGSMYLWEFERGKKTWRIPVRGNLITSDHRLMVAMAEAGGGLAYLPQPVRGCSATCGLSAAMSLPPCCLRSLICRQSARELSPAKTILCSGGGRRHSVETPGGMCSP